ncbi:MAG: N-formylglutamate amidohydrolase [Pseudomonadota bacterium]|nr:N-formylglutamate amidohydrolase [Pseudomonadota bacterium]
MRDDSQGLSEFKPPFEVVAPAGVVQPVVLNSPHSGAHYPQAFLAASRLDAATLRRSEDAFVDQLFAPATLQGAPLLRALFPRAFLDLNREPFELDPQMFEGRLPEFANIRSLRVAAGLGVIPRVVGDAQPIYRAAMTAESALKRIAALHRPYHARLAELIEAAQRRFGFALLLDCHSMPSTSPDVGGCDIVLGDRYGSSAARWVIETVESALRGAGLRVRRNKPYAGGYITEFYGAPAAGRHAVQIEINRSLYMDERALQLSDGAEPLGRALCAMVGALCASARDASGARWAAE